MQIVGGYYLAFMLRLEAREGEGLLSSIQLVQMITFQNDRNRWKVVTLRGRAGVLDAFLNQHFYGYRLLSL